MSHHFASRSRITCALMVVAALSLATGALAQAPPQENPTPAVGPAKWELEVHGGISLEGEYNGGTRDLPSTGAIVQGLISASTFYFGDGAGLFNQNQGGRTPITSLDPVVGGAAVKHNGELAVGGRIVRRLSRRFALEGSGDYLRGEWTFRADALSGIESARASFTSALQQTLSAGTTLPSSVTSVTTLFDHQTAPRLMATGALVVNLSSSETTFPYLVGGAGMIFNDGKTASVVLTGDYRIGNPAVLLGTDAVTLRFVEDDNTIVYLGGAGFKHALSRRTGFRVDGRVHFYENLLVNLVDVSPVRAVASNGAPLPIINIGALQFSATAPLSGVSMVGEPTFAATGLKHTITVSAGFYLRF